MLIKSINRIVAMTIVVMVITFLFAFTHQYIESSEVSQNMRIREIFHKLIVATGQSGSIPNLNIVNSPIVNAYASPTEIVIYTGMVDKTVSDDDIAMILGHEIAHETLGHTSLPEGLTEIQTQISESHADKLGAFYMMKAGYNICSARELWKRFAEDRGDYIGMDHPDYAYRYSQLDVQCK